MDGITFDGLMARRIALGKQTDVTDWAAYAQEWAKLAADFRAIGAVANAELCESNAARYGVVVEVPVE